MVEFVDNGPDIETVTTNVSTGTLTAPGQQTNFRDPSVGSTRRPKAQRAQTVTPARRKQWRLAEREQGT